jgi:hypothetical protein
MSTEVIVINKVTMADASWNLDLVEHIGMKRELWELEIEEKEVKITYICN